MIVPGFRDTKMDIYFGKKYLLEDLLAIGCNVEAQGISIGTELCIFKPNPAIVIGDTGGQRFACRAR
jgi:hypothetical protein